jgi:thioester reductase-like protein
MLATQANEYGAEQGAVMITGATGFIGMEILARYLERTERDIHLLVRAKDDREAAARARSTMACLFGCEDAYEGRIVPVAGDIQRPGLGLDRRRRDALAERVSDVIHSAASVSFSLPLAQSRDINVTGTARMLEFGELCRRRGGLNHFSYVSTAYVAGTHGGRFDEDQLDVGQDFRNPYEQSKFEAERLVRGHGDRLPIQVFRPSIVVGEHETGWTASFNVLYSPLKAFARGNLPAVPARRSAPVDVVPVDYVADAVFELSSAPAREPETFHLVAGERATTVGRLMELSGEYLGRRPPIVIPPPLYLRVIFPVLVRRTADRVRNALERSRVFFPYFSMMVAYGDERTRRRLEPAGIRVPPIESYFGRLLDYALRAGWGRSGLSRAEAVRGLEQSEHTGDGEKSPLREEAGRRA